jgi:hypothetical protein
MTIEKVICMIPVLIVVGGLGIVIGMYITTQIAEHIERRTDYKKFVKNMEDFDKKKQSR